MAPPCGREDAAPGLTLRSRGHSRFAEMHLRHGAAPLAFFVFAAWFVAPAALAQQTPAGIPDDEKPSATEPADSDAPPDESPSSAQSRGWHGLIELKRQNTSRNSPDESTRTTLKIDSFLAGPVSLLRLELPFPDEETDFSGSPFNPKLGDIKTRIGFRALKAGPYSYPAFIEVTFPTANPESLGSGKYQLSAGVRMLAPVMLPYADPRSHKSLFETQVQQVNSVGGDPDRKDISHTKLEFTLYDIWRGRYTFKLKVKPTVDWTRDGETGAVGELEGGILFARHWRTWLMFGRRLWGPEGIPTTYADRVEIGVARTF
jgi:hypothetical protein